MSSALALYLAYVAIVLAGGWACVYELRRYRRRYPKPAKPTAETTSLRLEHEAGLHDEDWPFPTDACPSCRHDRAEAGRALLFSMPSRQPGRSGERIGTDPAMRAAFGLMPFDLPVVRQVDDDEVPPIKWEQGPFG